MQTAITEIFEQSGIEAIASQSGRTLKIVASESHLNRLYFELYRLCEVVDVHKIHIISLYVGNNKSPAREFLAGDLLTYYRQRKLRTASMLNEILQGSDGTAHLSLDQISLLPGEELIDCVRRSPLNLVLTCNSSNHRYMVSHGYAEFTDRDWIGWMQDSKNKTRWQPGYLEQLLGYLERDRAIQNFEYQANFWKDELPLIWHCNARIIEFGAPGHTARLLQFTGKEKPNLAMV